MNGILRNNAWLLAALLLVAVPVEAQPTAPAYDHPLFTGPIHETLVARFDQRHLRLALRFDGDAHRVFGDATLQLAPLDSEAFDSTAAPLLFQAAGMLLLIAMVGAIVLTLRQREGVKKQAIRDQVYRRREDGVELKKVEPGQGA